MAERNQGTGDVRQPGEDDLLQLYRLMFETWRWQISSNWKRTDYFAAFQIGLLIAAGKVIIDGHTCVGVAISAFGIMLNISWILNDIKAGSYTSYWWKAVQEVEKRLLTQIELWGFASEYEDLSRKWQVRRECPKYGALMWFVRLLFTLAWITLIVVCLTILVLKHCR